MKYEIISIETVQELADAKRKIHELEHKVDLAFSMLTRLPIFVLPNKQIIQADIVIEEINKVMEVLKREV